MNLINPVINFIEGFLAWLSATTGQLSESFCDLETADSNFTYVSKDGSLLTIIKVSGYKELIGKEEFDKIYNNVKKSLQTNLARPGYAMQVFFQHDHTYIKSEINNILSGARQTARNVNLELTDLFNERADNLGKYCANEVMYLALWTKTNVLTSEQLKDIQKTKIKKLSTNKNFGFIRNAQNLIAGISELRDSHNSYVQSILKDLQSTGFILDKMDVHSAGNIIRNIVDSNYTSVDWQPFLPGDRLPIRETKNFKGELSDLLWPPLATQFIPRDGKILDLKFAKIGDKTFATTIIELFPKELADFAVLFNKLLPSKIPYRLSYLLESGGIESMGFKSMLSSYLSFASNDNKLIADASQLLNYINDNTDNAIVSLKIAASTWVENDDLKLLKTRAAELTKAIQGWGYCETSEITGDAYASTMSTTLGLSTNSVATKAIAPISDVTYMLPLTRPASPWSKGSVLFRSVDGKLWPYQPGSSIQTTWIDLVYARPGSGKSVLSNSINLALCLQNGLKRLPRIAIIDIGPSSSGLISLLQEALPATKRHYVAYHRLKMHHSMSINPFDTQLGCRSPTSQDRAFLVNFITLLATPISEEKAYDGIADMAGMIVDAVYKDLSDNQNTSKPNLYTINLNTEIDELIKELNIHTTPNTLWWEIVDNLFHQGYVREASIAQRYAMPLLSDVVAIARTSAVQDLYGNIKVKTGEDLISAFCRMISGVVREYPILSGPTAFDLGEAKIVSLDLDEVAKSGGEAADRQTAIMYMLARYVLARDFYLTDDALIDIPEQYTEYHNKRIEEIREDPKRIVLDEFHRTSKAQAVRDQVILDMREGRKWKVQVALLSQSLDDFDNVMVEFSTSIFIMDSGPKQAVDRTVKIFGLNETARIALETQVHGPRAEGATMLTQFSTKAGVNTQLLMSTIGPIELWAFNTNADDVKLRNTLNKLIGAAHARVVLAKKFPSGSAAREIENRMQNVKDSSGKISEEAINSVFENLITELKDMHSSS